MRLYFSFPFASLIVFFAVYLVRGAACAGMRGCCSSAWWAAPAAAASNALASAPRHPSTPPPGCAGHHQQPKLQPLRAVQCDAGGARRYRGAAGASRGPCCLLRGRRMRPRTAQLFPPTLLRPNRAPHLLHPHRVPAPQAILLDILLIFPSILESVLRPPMGGPGLQVYITLYNTVSVGCNGLRSGGCACLGARVRAGGQLKDGPSLCGAVLPCCARSSSSSSPACPTASAPAWWARPRACRWLATPPMRRCGEQPQHGRTAGPPAPPAVLW